MTGVQTCALPIWYLGNLGVKGGVCVEGVDGPALYAGSAVLVFLFFFGSYRLGALGFKHEHFVYSWVYVYGFSCGVFIVVIISFMLWLMVVGLRVGLWRGKRGPYLGRRLRTIWRRRPLSKVIVSSQYIKMVNKAAAVAVITVASKAGFKELPIDAGGIVYRGALVYITR